VVNPPGSEAVGHSQFATFIVRLFHGQSNSSDDHTIATFR
jgi:hypothetical protein